jgi:hypothetical protein
MGPSALIPIRQEGVLQIFIAFKNPSPLPGSNRQPLGPVASTLHHQGDRVLPLKVNTTQYIYILTQRRLLWIFNVEMNSTAIA